jgi:uncharacterized membrane protein
MSEEDAHPDPKLPSLGPPGHYGNISGDDLGRIIALSDGVFAFAMTLIVLSLKVPFVNSVGQSDSQISGALANALQQDYNAFLGYIFAFVMIAVWWIVHHRTFQYIARYDSTLVWLNMAILMEVAVMPFFLSVYTDYSGAQTAVAIFAGIQVSLGITTTMLWDYARRAKLVKPNIPDPVAQFFSRRGWLTAGVFAVSIGISFYSVTLAQVSWVSIFVLNRFLNRAGAPLPA